MKRIPVPASMLIGCTLLLPACSPRTYRIEGSTGEAIQKAIDKAAGRGGGVVVVPPGTYAVNSLQLKSHVELHLEKDAVLLGSTRSEDYVSFPEEVYRLRPEGSDKVLLYAYDAQDIAITGEGTFDGQGPSFFDTGGAGYYYPKPPVARPRMVQFVRCTGIRLSGVTFKDSPCWTMLIRLCRDIEVDGIRIVADQRMINNDGIDFDGCSHVRVRNADFKTCDDCIVLRAIREYPEQEVVCEDIRVEDCRLDSRCQTIRLGCPSDDTIRNAFFTRIEATGNNGIFADFPKRYLQPGDEGYMDLRNIVFDGYSGSFNGSAVQIVSEPGVVTRCVDGIEFRNFTVRSGQPLRFIGNPGREIGRVVLENFQVEMGNTASEPLNVSGCKDLVFKNVTINGLALPDGSAAR